MNDDEYLLVMADLKFISSVGENQFINLTNQSIENKNFFTQSIRRYYYRNETGQSTAKYCRAVIVRALKLYDKYVKEQNMSEFTQTIRKYIICAKIGIDHLKQTHSTNNMAYAIFDSIIVTIQQRLNIKPDVAEKLISI